MFRYLLICLMLFTGSAHTAEDDFDAVKKAAELGYAEAQYNLGLMYYKGEGVAYDKAEAVRWYRKAAEQGHADAQYKLGAMYNYYGVGATKDYGGGVTQDYAEAVRWYRKAAERGYTRAQYKLGIMYAYGVGVPEDDIQAYAWISLASAQGVENAKNAKERLTGEMTRAEIVEAQKLSRKYREAFGPGLNTQ